MKRELLFLSLLVGSTAHAGVFKCTDSSGATVYQSSPCEQEKHTIQINTNTGSTVDLNAQEEQEQRNEQVRQAKQQEEQARVEKIEQLKQKIREEQAKTKALMQKESAEFSAFAIPAYDYDNLPDNIKPFAERLADIEKFRRLAAQKALASGTCDRVEGDELNSRSKKGRLVFLISCSSGATIYLNENELTNP